MITQLRRHALNRPDLPALTVDGRTLTFAELDILSEAAAHRYAELGVEPGDRVAIVLPNSVEFVVAAFATLKVGATICPMSPRLPQPELTKLIQLADPKLLIGVHASTKQARLTLSGDLQFDGGCIDPLPLVVTRQWKVTTSGGTTGLPKLIVTTTAADVEEDAPPDYLLPKDEVVLIPGPLYHSAPFTTSLLSNVFGNHLLLCSRDRKSVV